MPTFQPDQSASLTKRFSAADVHAFAQAAGDFNPIHLDEAFARQSRFGRPIVHGMLTAGLISAVLGTQLPGPGCIYLSQELRFTAPVFIGDAITAAVTVTTWRPEKGILTLHTECRNQDGATVLTGSAVAKVDPPPSA